MTNTTPEEAEPRGPTHGALLLRRWFEENPHITKVHIAEEIGISKQSLGHLLVDRHRPTVPQALGIQSNCGVPIKEWVYKPR